MIFPAEISPSVETFITSTRHSLPHSSRKEALSPPLFPLSSCTATFFLWRRKGLGHYLIGEASPDCMYLLVQQQHSSEGKLIFLGLFQTLETLSFVFFPDLSLVCRVIGRRNEKNRSEFA